MFYFLFTEWNLYIIWTSDLDFAFILLSASKQFFIKMFMMNLMIPLIELISYDVNDSMDLIFSCSAFLHCWRHLYKLSKVTCKYLNEKSTGKGGIRKGWLKSRLNTSGLQENVNFLLMHNKKKEEDECTLPLLFSLLVISSPKGEKVQNVTWKSWMELATFYRPLKMSELWMFYLLSLQGWDQIFYDRQKLMSPSNT